MLFEDIPAGVNLCRLANWNQLDADWEFFLNADPSGSVVAIKNNEVVGTATTINYDNKFSWIGMVLVHPDHKNQGIGKQLLREAISIVQNQKTIKLDATPQGRELYLKLDFKDECHLSRMVAGKPGLPGSLKSPKSITKIDLKKIVDFDIPIFGAEREKLLNSVYQSNVELCFYAEDKTEVMGYCLGRKGARYTQIGPVVANNVEVAKQLVIAAAHYCQTSQIVMDVFHHSREWISWLNSIGFSEERSFVRMYRGENNFDGIINKQFAIAGPEFG